MNPLAQTGIETINRDLDAAYSSADGVLCIGFVVIVVMVFFRIHREQRRQTDLMRRQAYRPAPSPRRYPSGANDASASALAHMTAPAAPAAPAPPPVSPPAAPGRLLPSRPIPAPPGPPAPAAAQPTPDGPGSFRIVGVDRDTRMDTTWYCDAQTPANARAKGELEGILVTAVERVG